MSRLSNIELINMSNARIVLQHVMDAAFGIEKTLSVYCRSIKNDDGKYGSAENRVDIYFS